MEYLSGSTNKSDGCIFCDAIAANDDAARLIVHRGWHAFVILNRYPYNNGHLMVVPYAHVPSLEDLDEPVLTELMTLSKKSLAALRRVYQPQAFNMGINIGQAAGAGVVDHVHLHVLPRWTGDTNFMTSVSETRVIPERLEDTWARVREAWAGL